jgi:hypothetical protein
MTSKASIPRPPAGLGTAGTALFRSLVAEYELPVGEMVVLRMAWRQADDIATLEASIKRDGADVQGSTGQSKLNPALAEVRQARLALAKLIGEIALPDEDDMPRTASSRRAQSAANIRWSRVERERLGTTTAV